MELTDIVIRIRSSNVETVSKCDGDELFEDSFETARSIWDSDKFEATPTREKNQMPDVDVYNHKKTLAQGMMDLALLSANANQLRYVLESYRNHPYFYPSVVCITMSIVLQVAVGVGLVLNSRYNVKDKRQMPTANRINNFTTIGVFLVTVINVFLSAMGVADSPDVV